MRNIFRQNLYRKTNTFYVQLLLVNIVSVYEIIWKNVVKLDTPHRKIQYGVEEVRFVCRITKAITEIRIHNI